MTRLEPLTSMALGRSPYDDVVYGEGEGDPRAPLQLYDDRGRPVNTETRRLNKDIIRSHNEVMLVIGVVEPDNTVDEQRAELQRRQLHEQHDDAVGQRMEWAARACELAGVWGHGGMRQRILLYRRYSDVAFPALFRAERQVQSGTSLWLHGLPAFLVGNAMDFPWLADAVMKSNLAKAAFAYVQTCLKLWVFLQRTRLLPASASPWLPSWRFFIPFSTSSVIPPCPLPSTISVRSVAAWLGSVAASTMPVVAFYIVNGMCTSIADLLYETLYDLLPNPSNSGQARPLASGGLPQQRQLDDNEAEIARALAHAAQESSPAPAEQPAPSTTNVWDPPQQTTEQANAADTADRGHTPDNRTTTPPSHAEPSRPRSHPRRSHAPNTEDFSSDDEAPEDIVSATLISFDVENNPDTTDMDANNANAPPGVWSAELRPNPGSDSPGGGGARDGDGEITDGNGGARRPPRPRVYRDNALTQLPASLAAAMMARRLASLLLAPFEAASLRQVAWLWAGARGMSTDGMWEPFWLWPLAWRRGGGRFFGWDLAFGAGFSLRCVNSLYCLELAHFIFDACVWVAVIPWGVSRFLVSDEEWERRQKAAEQPPLDETSNGPSHGPRH